MGRAPWKGVGVPSAIYMAKIITYRKIETYITYRLLYIANKTVRGEPRWSLFGIGIRKIKIRFSLKIEKNGTRKMDKKNFLNKWAGITSK